MIAAEPVASRRFSRVNRRGHLQTARERVLVVRALRPPPHPVFEQDQAAGPRSGMQSGDENHDLLPAQVKVALPPRSAVGP